LLDEPFSGLDLVIKLSLLDEIRELAANQQMSVILVTHDPLEAASLCKNAIVLEDGRLKESGELLELLKNPTSQTLQTFKIHMPTGIS
ncbi:MAG: hypothetical protein HY075_13740, partial [Deltaproteobacteria bacterium]|nr:hypothetical protein [Deltaproteobacteria bacterium]